MSRLNFPLSDQGVHIREFDSDDFEKIHRYCSHPLVSEFQAWGPNTEEQSRHFHQLTLSEQNHTPRSAYNFAIVCDNLGVVGGAGIFLEGGNAANIGLSLHPDAWGKGIGVKAVKLLMFFCRNHLKLSKLIATADINNNRSVNLFKKLGFIHKSTIENERQVRSQWRTTVFLELQLTSTSDYLDKLNSLAKSQLSEVHKKCSPVSLIQKNILIHNTLLADKSSYNLGWAWKISDKISTLKIESAFNLLLNKHSILRCLVVQAEDGDRLLKMPSTVSRIDCSAQIESNLAKNLMRSNYSTPFNLDKEIPIRCFLISTESESYLQVLIHHAFIDGAGVAILKKDFSNLLLNSNESGAFSEDQGYFSYIRLENDEQSSEQLQKDLVFWNQYYHSFSPTRLFTADTTQVGQAKTVTQAADTKALNSIYQALIQLNIVEFPVFQLSLAMAVARQFQNLSFNIGTTAQLRDNKLFSESVGPLINTLKLKGELHLDKTIEQALLDLNNEHFDILAHQKTPYISLLEKIDNHASKEPFQIVLEFQRLLSAKNEFKDLEIIQRSAKFPLSLFIIHRSNDNIDITLEFDSKIVSTDLAEEFLQKFYKSLEIIALNWKSDRTISDILNFQPSSTTGASLLITHSISDKIMALRQRSDIVLHDSVSSFTGQQVFELSKDICNQVTEKYPNQDVISLEEERSAQFICNLLGIWLAGKSFHIISKNAPTMLKQNQIEMSGTQKSTGIPGYIMFSSGSTGTPKGVKIEEPAILNLLAGLQQLVSPLSTTSCLLNASFAFDASIQQLLLLLDGQRLFILSENERLDFSQWPEIIAKFKIDLIDCTPTQAAELINFGLFSKSSNLKAALIGGEKINAQLLSVLAQSHVKSFNVYGPCECTVDVTGTLVTSSLQVGELGFPFPNTKIDIVDSRGRILPQGFIGEIRISGPQVSSGYLDARDCLKFQDQSYLTGDLGFIDNNKSIHYLGRRDLQIKRAGVRIELDGITSIASRHNLVDNAHAHFDPASGKLYLLIKPKKVAQLDIAEIRSFLMNFLPNYAMPDLILILKDIPRNTSGKVDWNLLIADNTNELKLESIAEHPESEKAVALLWEKELKKSINDITINFFDIGGNSLSVFKIVMNIRSQLKVPFSVADFMENPTIKLTAKKIKDLKSSPNASNEFIQVKILNPGQNNNTSALVLFHAIGGNLVSYQSLLKSLNFYGTIIGISSSEIPTSTEPLNISDYVQKIYNSIFEYAQNKSCYLLGWSFGGMLALEFEKKYRKELDLKSLILIDTYLNPVNKMNLNPLDILRSAVLPFLKNRKISDKRFTEICNLQNESSNTYLNAFINLKTHYSELTEVDVHEFLQLVEKIKYFRTLASTFDFNIVELDIDTYIFNADQNSNSTSGRINIQANSTHKTISELVPGDHFSIVDSPILAQKINSIWKSGGDCE